MKRITVYEHQNILLRPEGSLTRRAYQHLIVMADRLPAGAISPLHNGVRTGSYCGLLQCGDLVIEILPKIHRGKETIPARGCLVEMLAICFDLPLYYDGLAETGEARDLLDVVIETFLNEAVKQAKCGLVRQYQSTEGVLARPRGRLMLAEQTRRGRASAAALHCQFDELTPDNRLNRALKAALKAIPVDKRGGRHPRSQLLYLEAALAEVEQIRMSGTSINSIRLDRLSSRYRSSLDLAAWVVQLLGPDVHGEDEQGVSLLFDMNMLFEGYVARMLASAFQRDPRASAFSLAFQGPSLSLVRDERGVERFGLLPDISIKSGRAIVAIADTKWKTIDQPAPGAPPDVSQADLYQVLAYGQTYGVPVVYLLYPHHDSLMDWSSADLFYTASSSHNVIVRIRAVDLSAPVESMTRLMREVIEADESWLSR